MANIYSYFFNESLLDLLGLFDLRIYKSSISIKAPSFRISSVNLVHLVLNFFPYQ